MKISSEMKKKIVALYHADCPDGFGAAWAAWKKFGSKAGYIPMKHDDPISKKLKNKKVYFLDITYTGNKLKKIIKDNQCTTIIDHHISAESEIKKAPNYSYALNHSGAVLSWQFFHPKRKMPKLLLYIEDRDLWKWKIPNSKEILAAVDLTDMNFKKWDKIAADLEKPSSRKKYKEAGKSITLYKQKTAGAIFKKVKKVKFGKLIAGAVNSPILESEIGEMIYKAGFPVAIIWRERNGKIKVSLRSNGKVDVSKLATKYGGGGHKAAAGFTFESKVKLPWRYLSGPDSRGLNADLRRK